MSRRHKDSKEDNDKDTGEDIEDFSEIDDEDEDQKKDIVDNLLFGHSEVNIVDISEDTSQQEVPDNTLKNVEETVEITSDEKKEQKNVPQQVDVKEFLDAAKEKTKKGWKLFSEATIKGVKSVMTKIEQITDEWAEERRVVTEVSKGKNTYDMSKFEPEFLQDDFKSEPQQPLILDEEMAQEEPIKKFTEDIDNEGVIKLEKSESSFFSRSPMVDTEKNEIVSSTSKTSVSKTDTVKEFLLQQASFNDPLIDTSTEKEHSEYNLGISSQLKMKIEDIAYQHENADFKKKHSKKAYWTHQLANLYYEFNLKGNEKRIDYLTRLHSLMVRCLLNLKEQNLIKSQIEELDSILSVLGFPPYFLSNK